MTDIIIIRQRHGRALIVPKSVAGTAWIMVNMALSKADISISTEFTDELAEHMRKEGLEVDIK